MSGYENIVGGKLKLKGKALDVKAAGIKKKKKHKKPNDPVSQVLKNEHLADQAAEEPTDPNAVETTDAGKLAEEGKVPSYDDHLTPAERRYIEQREQLDVRKLAREADKSHRDRIQDFNQYLANLSEHYDIPKVGPG